VDKGTEKEPLVSKYFPSLLAAGTLALCLVVSSCAFSPSDTTSTPSATETLNTDTAKLSGYWKSGYDGFEVNGTAFTQYGDTAKGVSFAGTVVNVRNITPTKGYLTILITNSGSWGNTTVGFFYVVAWEIISDKTIKESAAYKSGSTSNAGMLTRIAAENEFTIDNGYFGMFGDYNKQ